MNDQTSVESNPLETVLGGANLTLALSRGGVVTVKVRQLPVDLWDTALDVALDEPKFIELVCNQEAGWANTLTPRARTEVAEAVEKVNEDFFAFLARRSRAIRRVAPGAFNPAVPSR